MYLKITFALTFVLFLISCGSNSNNKEIELNNGEKWKVNAEMMPPLKASNKLVSEFMANSQKDYKALAEKLKENNQLLISSCTMKGKSHDELHKWLHPYMNLVSELEGATDEAEANQILLKIDQSFEAFNRYFQ